MAKCSHIRTLNRPFSESFLVEGHEADRLWRLSDHPDRSAPQHGWPHDVRPYGRFMAEYWLTNDRGVRPDHDADYLEYKEHMKGRCLVDRSAVCSVG
mmetsp:Transcript_27191/g.54286  ORF Transcript_27191/g.54286 Transcript_27191/m.54286 type:complete len:97 (+) Transcript_27191:286-576(+)